MENNKFYRGMTALSQSSPDETCEGIAYTFVLFVIAYAIAALG